MRRLARTGLVVVAAFVAASGGRGVEVAHGAEVAQCLHRWHSVPFPGRGSVTFGDVAVHGSRAWALGYDGHRAVVERWDGHAWRRMTAPVLGPYEGVNGIAATGPKDVWLVGSRDYAIDSGPVPLSFHWDGRSWTRFRVPRAIVDPYVGGGGGSLVDVIAIRSDDVWAVGTGNGFDDENDEALIVHWTGDRWKRSPWDANQLVGVSEGRNGNVWAAGWNDKEVSEEEVVVRVNGVWQPAVSLGDFDWIGSWFNDIDAEGSSVWAVGGFYTHDTEGAIIERWDGEQFQLVPVAGAIDLYAVTQVDSHAFAVGRGYSGEPVIEGWARGVWRPMHLPAGWADRTLSSIEAGPDGSVWAVGSFIARSCIGST
jgi:hypothetical protein